jgi:thioredoxin-dependent peroxiredoxin
VVLGISADSVESHAKFKKKHELPYTLLADTEHKVSDAYGVWGPKSIFGVKYDGISRTTFLIDEEGRVAKVFEKVKSAGHGDEVAAGLAAAR